MTDLSIDLQFPTPPTLFTHRELVTGSPFSSGVHLLQRNRGILTCDAFGIAWSLNSYPSGIGLSPKVVTDTDRDFLQLVELKTDSAAELVPGRRIDTRQVAGYTFFSEFPLVGMNVWIYPNCTVNFYWVVVF